LASYCVVDIPYGCIPVAPTGLNYHAKTVCQSMDDDFARLACY
jgi:hypothetical protein